MGSKMPTCEGVFPRPLDPPDKGRAPCIPQPNQPSHPATAPLTFPPRMPSKPSTAYMKTFREMQRKAGVRRVSVTLSAAEYERLDAHARAQDERLTSHLKACAFAHLDTRYIVPPDIAERLDSLLSILRGVGNNLNQLARHSNEVRAFLDAEEVRLQVRRMDEAVRAFVERPPTAHD